MNHDRVIATIAEDQHGLLTRPQYLAHGIPDTAVAHRMRQGRVERLYPGVYRVAGQPTTWPQRILAACLAAGEGAVASHRAAGYLIGLAGIEPAIEVTLAGTRCARVGGIVLHRVRRLDRSDTETRDAVPHTRVARTLIDLAAVVPVPVLEQALDDALARRLVTCAHLLRRLDAVGRRGRRGIAQLALLIGQRTDSRALSQSEFERALVGLLVDAGLPPPVCQYRVPLPAGGYALLDAAYPDLLIGIEADSYRYHSSRSAWSRDRVRNRQLTAMGWLMLPVTCDDVSDRPHDVLKAVLEARATQLLAKMPA